MGQIEIELIKAGLTAVVSLTTLGAGWLIGQRITLKWNIRQKRRESQLETNKRFYDAYGEFFVTWKLWNRLDKKDEKYSEKRWELLKRASASEAIIEATLLKLAAEVSLHKRDVENLGRFRQAFQTVREAIRDDRPVDWKNSDHPDYLAFKKLACEAAALLKSDWNPETPDTDDAFKNLRSITSNCWEKQWMNNVIAKEGDGT